MIRINVLSILIFLCFSIQAQHWSYISYEFNSQFRDRIHFKSNLIKDSALFLGIEGYTRAVGYDFTDLVVVDARDGKIIRKKPLSGISGTPFITDIGFFEDIGYLVEYKDVINFSSTFNLRKYEFRSYEDDRVLWSGTGGLAPVGQGNGTTINAKVFSDSSAWFENYYTGNLYRLNLISGDTLATVSSNLIASQLGLDTASVGALLGKLDSKYIRLRSDTVMAIATDFQLDSAGIYQPRVFATNIDGLTYSSINGYLMPLPTPPIFSRDLPFDEYHYVIDSSQVLWGKGYVKRILGTRSVIDGSIADSALVIDSLYYNPDTARFRENAPYELYRNGEYLAYVESLIWPYFGDTSIVANQSRLRLYRGEKLLYEEIILDTLVRTGGVNTTITHLHILEDGSVIAIMKVGDDRPYTVSRVMRINPDGSHFLSNNSDSENPETGIKFFPNPTSGFLYLDVPANLLDSLIEVRVFSLPGKEIYYKEIKSTEPIDLSGIQKGLYLLNLIGNGESYSEKLIVID